MKRCRLALATLMVGAAICLPRAGAAEEEDASCESACYEAEEVCDARCEEEEDEDLCGDACEAEFNRCIEKCDQRFSEDR